MMPRAAGVQTRDMAKMLRMFLLPEGASISREQPVTVAEVRDLAALRTLRHLGRRLFLADPAGGAGGYAGPAYVGLELSAEEAEDLGAQYSGYYLISGMRPDAVKWR